MLRNIILFMLLVLSMGVVYSQNSVVLKEIYKPHKIEIYNEKLYVAQGCSFFIYSLKDLNLIKIFCRKGEGPGELKNDKFNNIHIIDNQIFVSGEFKGIYFTEDGELIREIKKSKSIFEMVPFGENFAVTSLDRRKFPKTSLLGIRIADLHGKIQKVVQNQKFSLEQKPNGSGSITHLFPDTPHFVAYKNKLFVERSEKGFIFEVFNLKGDKIYTITHNDFARTPVTDKIKNNYINTLKNDKTFVGSLKYGGWDNFIKRHEIKFVDYFSTISDFVINQNRIYVRTSKIRNHKTRFIVMDIKGKLLKTIFLPIQADLQKVNLFGRESRLYKFYNGKFYYLKENKDVEDWEFNVVKF